MDCILMGYNGAECLSAKKEARKRIFHNPLPTGSINEIIQFCQSNNHFLNVYHEGIFSLIVIEGRNIKPERRKTLRRV